MSGMVSEGVDMPPHGGSSRAPLRHAYASDPNSAEQASGIRPVGSPDSETQTRYGIELSSGIADGANIKHGNEG